MKFKRLTDNLPAYKAGEVYSAVRREADWSRDFNFYDLSEEDRGYSIKNDMGSCYYFKRQTTLDKIKFDGKWEIVE